jgi:hypothetical protein
MARFLLKIGGHDRCLLQKFRFICKKCPLDYRLMADSSKKGTISVTRVRNLQAQVIFVTGFRLRMDKVNGLIDIFLEASGRKGIRIVLDSIIIGTNLNIFKQFLAAVPGDADETVVREDVTVIEEIFYSNMLHFVRQGERGETIFSFLSLLDWASQSRTASRTDGTVESADVVIVLSSAAFQKKLLIEISLLLAQIKDDE